MNKGYFPLHSYDPPDLIIAIQSVMAGNGGELKPKERAEFASKLYALASRYRHEKPENTIACSFITHSREMRTSPAWGCLPYHARRILDRLEIEHMDQDGSWNGSLQVSYEEFVDAGIPNKRSVALAVRQCEALGFLTVKHGGRGEASLYCLTYVNGRGASPFPTDTWRRIKTRSAAQKLLAGLQ
jgi:hypothetical protein